MARLALRYSLLLTLLSFTPASAYASGAEGDPGAAGAISAGHPLDPLTFTEYWTVLETLRDAGHLDAATRFSIVQLAEPDKKLVWSWQPGQAVPRAATAVVRQEAASFEAVVDLIGRKLVTWKKIEGVQPNWLDEEFGGLAEVVKAHPDFIAAMKKRGYDDLTFIDCWSVGPGYYGTEEQQGRRIGHFTCYDAAGRRNTWSRTIPGLTTVVDMTAQEVLRVVDEEGPGLPDASADYDPEAIGGLRAAAPPISIEQPLGAAFKIDGHLISWDRWRFHVRADQRVGPVVGTVSLRDGERLRPVLYQGSLSEIFVPYMDPSFAWYWRNFIDAGEFSAGGLLKPLLRGRDCPLSAAYLDMLVASDAGRPVTVRDAICIYEQLDGEPSWRHWSDHPDSRPKRDLVVRSAVVLGNYDYLLDWVFQQNGSIRIGVGATGIVESRVVGQQKHGDAGPPDDLYGHFVDEHIVGVNHDHYFSFRLDLDVDGTTNRFVADRLVTKELPPDHPRRSIWVVDQMEAKRESEAKMKIDLDRPKLWRVLSENTKNGNGYPTSFQLMPGKNGATLLAADDYPRRRAGFIDKHLWVTPYRSEERYAAGDYPTLSTPGQGLPAWTSADRSIESTDLVLWHTVAMHHFVRAEDWPVMPVMWHTFELRPFDFFDRNPALDLPLTP